ncbi:MAG: hypothetical protein HYX63_14230 [Gammaproteobacteria bacterium]|nr:hypothetical protein [Gammaproteobacteria bacterium]
MQTKTTRSLVALSLLAVSMMAGAGPEYCTTPYLNATNIRPSCEQFGTTGLSGLYKSNLFINRILNTPLNTAQKISGPR